jgi:hypothetical protein
MTALPIVVRLCLTCIRGRNGRLRRRWEGATQSYGSRDSPPRRDGISLSRAVRRGSLPAYLLEHSGHLRDAADRCPERIPSEQGYDAECVRDLIAHGPIYLGKELLASSFVLGAVALVGAFRLDRRSVTLAAATLLLSPYFLIGSPLAFWRRGGEPIEAAYLVGLVMIVAAAALAWVWNRRAVVVLSTVYVAAWIGLLAWNAERARHFLGEGI